MVVQVTAHAQCHGSVHRHTCWVRQRADSEQCVNCFPRQRAKCGFVLLRAFTNSIRFVSLSRNTTSDKPPLNSSYLSQTRYVLSTSLNRLPAHTLINLAPWRERAE